MTKKMAKEETKETAQERTLFLNGTIAEESWFSDELRGERVVGVEAEDADGEGSPDAVDEVDGECADRVVEAELVEEEDGEDDDDAGDGADDGGGGDADAVGSGGDADESGEAAVEGHGEVRVLEKELAGDHAGDERGGGGDHGVDEGERDDLGVGVEGGGAVEAEPSEPEEEDADGGDGHVVSHDGHGLAVDVLADAGTEEHDAGEGGPAADGVDERGAGEVMEVHVGEPAAAPAPGADERIDQRDVDGGEDEVAGELDAFGDGTADDGGGGGGEHALEEEVRPVGVVAVVVVDGGAFRAVEPEAGEAEELAADPGGSRIHEGEAADGVGEEADGGGQGVLEEDVVAVLGPCESGLDAGEAEVHDEDQAAAQHHPQVVHGEHRLAWLGRRRRLLAQGAQRQRHEHHGQ